MANFFENSYELENSWIPTDAAPQKLTKSQLDDVRQAVIRDHTLEDGTVIKNVVFMMKSSKPKSVKLSPYNAQFRNGTRVNPASVEITEFTNDAGELRYTATCDEA